MLFVYILIGLVVGGVSGYLYRQSQAGKKKTGDAAAKPANMPSPEVPFSFNPIVRLEWPTPEKLYIETAYVSLRSELIKTFSRWHLLTLSPQSAVLRRG